MASERNPPPGSPASSQRFVILGTAGHIDHGKTRLVKALTGIDTDRLPEEKARGMTIELGFAHFVVDDIRFGVVDVPGHERFVRRMVAGSTGISLALLVVAADDGVMPQTEEHATILDLLGVRHAVVALTKCDLVDPDRIEQVRREVNILLAGLSLRGAPVVPVSSETGQGLDALRQALVAQARLVRPPEDSQIFRLGIDRVFTIHGRGTVVTGSVLSGSARTTQTLELLPGGRRCRVRELQVHGQPAESVGPGQRAAFNLVGVERDQVARGDELASPGYLTPSRYLDARLQCLRGSQPIKPTTRVRLAASTWEQMATVIVLEAQAIRPGESGLVQFRLRRPVVASFGQRFIIRDETARTTVGGGRMLRPVSRRLSRRQQDELAGLAKLESDDPLVRVGEVVRFAGFRYPTIPQIACQAGVEPDQVPAILERLQADGALVPLGQPQRLIHRQALLVLADRARRHLRAFHEQQPTQVGIHVDSFVGWLNRKTTPELGRAVLDWLVRQGHLARRAEYVCEPGFAPAISPQDQQLLEQIIAELHAAGFRPPLVGELQSAQGQNPERIARLLEFAKADGTLVQVSEKLWFHAARLTEIEQVVRAVLAEIGPATVSQIKSHIDLSRKFMIPLLEYFDGAGVTRRVGNKRALAESG